jgi:fructose-bisphosphate aldolase, class II
MSIVTLREVLADAERRNYAVGSHNVVDFQAIKGIILAAEAEKAPVIIAVLEELISDRVPLDTLAAMLVCEAKKTKAPIVIHIDHGQTFETIKKAIDLGFSSIMFDGSRLPFEENIRRTKEVAEYAHKRGVSLEAEIGEMTNTESGGRAPASPAREAERDTLTNPEAARDFAARSDIDALAVSYGSIHGLHAVKPNLDFARLEEINRLVDIPLVLHGGSGLSPEDYKRSIELGIRKINYVSFGYNEVAKRLKQRIIKDTSSPNYMNYADWSIDFFRDVFRETMRAFGSSGKA